MDFKHYIITRFNLRVHYGCELKDPDNDPMQRIFDEDYLEERFDLFEKYTLPSIKNQVNQNFTWLVLFHKNTPEKFLKRIQELKGVYDFEDHYFEDGEVFTNLNFRTKDENYDFYITTRIDNDDMIEETFIKRIQDYAADNLHNCVISFPNGEKLDVETNKRYRYYINNNAFCTLVGPKGTSILKTRHTKIFEDNEGVFLKTDKPMWTAIIHDSNVSNRITDFDLSRGELNSSG